MPAFDNDKALYIQIKASDKKSFDTLFTTYYTPLCHFSISVLLNESWAEEAVQNTFVRLWEKRQQLEVNESLKAYLYRSVYNESLRLRQKQSKSKALEMEYAQWFLSHEDTVPLPDWSVAAELINKAIAHLPEKCRDIFIMRRKEGLTNEEVANYLNISVKTVESQMSIALNKLKTELQPLLKHLPILLFLFKNL